MGRFRKYQILEIPPIWLQFLNMFANKVRFVFYVIQYKYSRRTIDLYQTCMKWYIFHKLRLKLAFEIFYWLNDLNKSCLYYCVVTRLIKFVLDSGRKILKIHVHKYEMNCWIWRGHPRIWWARYTIKNIAFTNTSRLSIFEK